MRLVRRSLLVLAGLGLVVCVVAAHYYYKGFYKWKRSTSGAFDPHGGKKAEADRLSQKAAQLKAFLFTSRKSYNGNMAFLIDMHLPSGKNRFFVYDLRKDSVLLSGLVAHGSGNRSFSLSPVFSNANGSSCSALGRYRIGNPYAGQFGRAYLLYGLDTTNSRALERHIVLHAYTCVPEGETDPYPICNSRGCPMVSPAFLEQLQPMIDASKKPILLWIFD
ncbi:MAG TPA: murein L,D-transpeptidase catalytic domain family protein [Puia sp.]|nr:murein L,D-transpeptidase catalytic domain family protein [Puia sp.]